MFIRLSYTNVDYQEVTDILSAIMMIRTTSDADKRWLICRCPKAPDKSPQGADESPKRSDK
jgi:hypothetical protein